MIIYVDIDETICTLGKHSGSRLTRDYGFAKPRSKQIEKINKLYDEGHEITYWSARGSTTGINWYDITYRQLQEWGCKFHDLSTGSKGKYVKPACDLVIDDKAKRIEEV